MLRMLGSLLFWCFQLGVVCFYSLIAKYIYIYKKTENYADSCSYLAAIKVSKFQRCATYLTINAEKCMHITMTAYY